MRLTTLRQFATPRPQLQQWDGTPLPPGVRTRLTAMWERLLPVRAQRQALVAARRTRLHGSEDPAVAMVRQLLRLKGIGEVSAWLYPLEFFRWRRFKNRREVGALASVAPIPRRSGDVTRDAGMSKAGNATLRALTVELAWSWLRRQPKSALSLWYVRRYATGGTRMRRMAIVAVARQLLVALWRDVEHGQVPAGPS